MMIAAAKAAIPVRPMCLNLSINFLLPYLCDWALSYWQYRQKLWMSLGTEEGNSFSLVLASHTVECTGTLSLNRIYFVLLQRFSPADSFVYSAASFHISIWI